MTSKRTSHDRGVIKCERTGGEHDLRESFLCQHEAAMLEQDVHVGLPLMSGALHRGFYLLVRVHINDDPVLGELLLHEDDLLCALHAHQG